MMNVKVAFFFFFLLVVDIISKIFCSISYEPCFIFINLMQSWRINSDVNNIC